MLYKNTSYTEKTFYGVKFKPGETKEVDGIINSKCMILADEPAKETKVQQKPSSEKPKKEDPKPVDPEKEEPQKEEDPKKDTDKDKKS